jgi:hypothetical protein
MKYTNGFDIDLVLPALQQRLGWLQPTIAGSPVISAPNLVSKSGRCFNDGSYHALCTVDNIKNNQEDPAITDTELNAFLIQYQKSEIMRALNAVFVEPELIEQSLMYTRFGLNDYPLPNQSQWVGWCIEVANDFSISTQITMGTFYFDKDCTVTMYLFMDGVREPLQTITVDVIGYARTGVDFDSLVLNYKTGMRYFFLYDQNELEAQGAHAIREQVETIATTYCFEAYNYQAYRSTDGSYFNHNNRQFPALPGGVNLEIITFKDHTQKILRKANLFDEVQGLQMAAMVIELINTSTRTNLNQRQTEQQSNQLFIELNQAFATKEVPVNPGLKSRIAQEFKRLIDTFFPPQKAISTSMITDSDGMLDSYEQIWAKQNWKVMNNPGVLISDG